MVGTVVLVGDSAPGRSPTMGVLRFVAAEALTLRVSGAEWIRPCVLCWRHWIVTLVVGELLARARSRSCELHPIPLSGV